MRNNTIFISGTYKAVFDLQSGTTKVQYNVQVLCHTLTEPLTFITVINKELDGYGQLWRVAKENAAHYFNDPKLTDGAYTSFMDNLTRID